MLKDALIIERDIIKKDAKTGHTLNILKKDTLPDLKRINPSIEQIEQFMQLITVQDNGHRFDAIIL